MPIRHRLVALAALTVAVLAAPLGFGAGVAAACACGAYSPTRGGTAAVTHETALVRSNGGGVEDVYLSLTVDSDVRSGALLFPVPDRTVDVSAGPRTLFTELETLTAQRAAPGGGYSGPGQGAAAKPPVVVERRQSIGPLDVVTLSARSADALDGWLSRNGFTPKPALAAIQNSYLAKGWAFVAVRLRPGADSGSTLDGRLDPLRLHFRSARVVYPMRLSRLAGEAQHVTIYTLGAKPLALTTADPGMRRTWSGRVVVPEPSGAAGSSTLAGLRQVTSAGTDQLTRYDGDLTPARITDDFHFTPTTAASATTAPASARSAPDAVGDVWGRHRTGVTVAAGLAVIVVGALAIALLRGRARRRSGQPTNRSRP